MLTARRRTGRLLEDVYHRHARPFAGEHSCGLMRGDRSVAETPRGFAAFRSLACLAKVAPVALGHKTEESRTHPARTALLPAHTR